VKRWAVAAWCVVVAGCGVGHAAPTTVTPSPAPTSAPVGVLNTGGAQTGTYPGSGCQERLMIRSVPANTSTETQWATSHESGWPLGWPGLSPAPTVPTSVPSVTCSR
jgi:hypothetical protein